MSYHARMLFDLLAQVPYTWRQPEADSLQRSIRTIAGMLIAGTYRD